MKLTNLKHTLLVSFGIISIFMFTACSNSDNPVTTTEPTNEYTAVDEETVLTLPTEDLSAEETSGILFMREEEKLARDVYITLYNKWKLRVFNNISYSEQKHTDAIKLLIDKYQLTDPVISDSVGAFTNEVLDGLYTQLTTQGDSSLVEALKVGALIEEIDILDLKREMEENVNNEDITYVYERLLNGSYKHLRAFVRNLERNGVIYSPIKLSEEEYQAIISN